MVVIRLSRGGMKKKPFYHIVVADQRCPRDGKCLERIGYFNPFARGNAIRLNFMRDRVNYWRSVGAQLSARVASLVKEWDKTVQVASIETK